MYDKKQTCPLASFPHCCIPILFPYENMTYYACPQITGGMEIMRNTRVLFLGGGGWVREERTYDILPATSFLYFRRQTQKLSVHAFGESGESSEFENEHSVDPLVAN